MTQVTMVGKEQITTVSDGLLVLAPAKINLSLLIAGKRPDGFHEIETVMAKIDLFDEILIQKGQKAGIELSCTGPCWAPQGKENLIYQACEMLLAEAGTKPNLKITLTKNIPAGSGLGSASSDAAATLIGLKTLLKSEIKHEKLADIAANLGSDVPFFLGGPLAYCTGKGEKIKNLQKNFNFSAILILPDISVSTKEVYANYGHDPALYQRLSRQVNGHLQKNRIDLISKMCANVLQTSCFDLHKKLGEIKKNVESLGIGPVCLSGSGSAMFSIVDNQDKKSVGQYQKIIEQNIRCKSVTVSNNRW